MGVLDAAVEKTVAAGSARLRLFRAHGAAGAWLNVGHGTSDFSLARTHMAFRPIPPDSAPAGLPPETEVEYLFDGGCRWVKLQDAEGWGHPLGGLADPRQVSDPTWILDALLGATSVSGARDVADGRCLSLDLTIAGRVLDHSVDVGRGRVALLWRPRLRRWRKAVPARVWLDQNGRLRRVEHLDPPWSRVFPGQTWTGVEFSALGEPVDLPASPSATIP